MEEEHENKERNKRVGTDMIATKQQYKSGEPSA